MRNSFKWQKVKERERKRERDEYTGKENPFPFINSRQKHKQFFLIKK